MPPEDASDVLGARWRLVFVHAAVHILPYLLFARLLWLVHVRLRMFTFSGQRAQHA
jgi:hypothetical protein